jgi:hypothetical protein
MAQAVNDGHLGLATLDTSLRGWINHVRYANTIGLRKAIFSTLHLRPQPGRPRG